MATFINLTPHTINVVQSEVGTMVVPPSGNVARCAQTTEIAYNVGDIVCRRTVYGNVEGLPDRTPSVFYIVSALVRTAVPNRADVLSPGELVRDSNGQPIGCKGLICN